MIAWTVTSTGTNSPPEIKKRKKCKKKDKNHIKKSDGVAKIGSLAIRFEISLFQICIHLQNCQNHSVNQK